MEGTETVLAADVDDEDLEELREEGRLRFRFPGDVIMREPAIDLNYVGDADEEEA